MAGAPAVKLFRLAAAGGLLAGVALSGAPAPPSGEAAPPSVQRVESTTEQPPPGRATDLVGEERAVTQQARERAASAVGPEQERVKPPSPQPSSRPAPKELGSAPGRQQVLFPAAPGAQAAQPAPMPARKPVQPVQKQEPSPVARNERAAAPAKAAPNTFIPVVGAGGQAAVDRCAGPVRFTPVTVSVSIAEHDLCGGWSRMSWIQPGTVVTVQGYGTFTAFARMVVPRGAKEGVLGGFAGGFPPVVLQTCIPGTLEMLLIALH